MNYVNKSLSFAGLLLLTTMACADWPGLTCLDGVDNRTSSKVYIQSNVVSGNAQRIMYSDPVYGESSFRWINYTPTDYAFELDPHRKVLLAGWVIPLENWMTNGRYQLLLVKATLPFPVALRQIGNKITINSVNQVDARPGGGYILIIEEDGRMRFEPSK